MITELRRGALDVIGLAPAIESLGQRLAQRLPFGQRHRHQVAVELLELRGYDLELHRARVYRRS